MNIATTEEPIRLACRDCTWYDGGLYAAVIHVLRTTNAACPAGHAVTFNGAEIDVSKLVQRERNARARQEQEQETPIGFPKPRRRVLDRVADKLDRDRRAMAFRLAVWARDESRCRACQRRVRRTLDLVPEQGHVHHRRGRNVTPEDRYNVDEALLLCLLCHKDPVVVQRFRKVT